METYKNTINFFLYILFLLYFSVDGQCKNRRPHWYITFHSLSNKWNGQLSSSGKKQGYGHSCYNCICNWWWSFQIWRGIHEGIMCNNIFLLFCIYCIIYILIYFCTHRLFMHNLTVFIVLMVDAASLLWLLFEEVSLDLNNDIFIKKI